MCQLQRDRFLLAKNLASAEETARWEKMLDQISFGEGSDKVFIGGIKDFVAGMVKEFKESEVPVAFSQPFFLLRNDFASNTPPLADRAKNSYLPGNGNGA